MLDFCINNKNIKSYDSSLKAQPSFKGLTTVAQRTLYSNAETIKKFADIQKSSIVGNIPSDFIKHIKAMTNDVGPTIKKVTDGFALANQKLLETNNINENAFIDIVNNGTEKDLVKIYCDILDESISQKSVSKIRNLCHSITNHDFTDNIKINKLKQDAENIIQSTLEKTNIISGEDSVSIKDIGQGVFGHCHKISFADKNGKSIYSNKVIKTFKDLNQETKFRSAVDYLETVVLGHHGEEVLNHIKKSSALSNEQNPAFIEFLKDYIKANIDIAKTELSLEPSLLSLKLTQNAGNQNAFKKLQNRHGLYAEANAFAYIKKSIPYKMKDSNIAQQFYYDLKGKYAISEFVDDSNILKSKNVKFDLIGISSKDANTLNNTKNGKIIDLGDFVVSDKIIARQIR